MGVTPGEVEAKIAAFRADPRVEFAEPDYIAQVAYGPNDPSYGNGCAPLGRGRAGTC